jgi:hypothetical protein
MKVMSSRSSAMGALSAALLAITTAVAAAQGTLQGTVTAAAGGTPLQEARVLIVGTSFSVATGPDGKYIIRRVPDGTAEVRVLRVGYQEQKKVGAHRRRTNGDARLCDAHVGRSTAGSRDDGDR